jgi:hypothetical protein
MKSLFIFVFILFVSSISFAEEKSDISGLIRVDHDAAGFQFWAGAVHPITKNVGVGSYIYLTTDNVGELDLGPTFTFGPVIMQPMIGFGFDWIERDLSYLGGYLFTFADIGSFHLESWVQYFANSAFNGGDNVFYTRDFILVKPWEYFYIGPQAEFSVNTSGNISIPIGGRLNVEYGSDSTLGIFLAGDPQQSGLSGRLTFVQTW